MAARKSFLLGLGIGLIVTALILRLAEIGEPQLPPQSPQAVDISIEALREAAEQQGYVLYAADETLYSEEELQSKLKEVSSKEKEAVKVVAFTISSGTELSTISAMLYDLGLVDDRQQFVQEMEDRGLASKVQAKYYRFDKPPTMDALITELTTR